MSALLDRLIAQRSKISDDLKTLVSTVEERAASGGDDHLTDAEQKNMADADALAKELDERIAGLTALEQREAAAAAIAVSVLPSQGVEQRAIGGARVTNEPTTYDENGRNSWVLDSLLLSRGLSGFGGLNSGTNADEAVQRRERYAQELEVEHRSIPFHTTLIQRDATTTSYASLVPPQYLLNEYAALLRAGRPFANLCNGMGLPDAGMTMTIPRATAGTTVSTQATQNAAPTTTDMTVTDLVIPVNSFTGRAVLSRQSVERGGVNLDRLTFADLAADAARYMDQQAMFGSGASNNALGAVNTGSIIAVAITGTTGLDLIKAVGNALQAINKQRLAPADVIVMAPRRWGALTIATDSSNRPLVSVEAGQLNVFGQGDAAAVQTTVGTILGVPVVTDPNIRENLGVGTNQDEVIVLRRGDSYLWENAIREFTFEQPAGPQSVQLAVYGNHAFTAGRYPTAVAYISGAGLVPPTF